MSITGNLETMELAEILQWLSHAKKTGTLLIDNGAVQKRIFFEKGKIISSAASDPKEYLGHFLVSHGFLDELTLAKAMEMQDDNRMLLGKILVSIGAISEQDLDKMLRLKAEESIYEIFTWPEGDFEFKEGELPGYTMVPLELSVEGLILEGHQRVDEWRVIHKKIPSMQVVPVAVGELEAVHDEGREQKILELVNDDRTVQEIALQTHCGEFQVCRVLYEQVRRGRLKLVRPRSAQPEGGEQGGGDEAGALMAAARRHIEQSRFDLALRYMRAARSLEPNSRRVQSEVAAAEALIADAVAADGLHPESIPRLEAPLDEIDSLDLTPQEGFILSRVDGAYDIKTILKISPIPPLDAMVVLWRLVKAGRIGLEEPKKR